MDIAGKTDKSNGSTSLGRAYRWLRTVSARAGVVALLSLAAFPACTNNLLNSANSIVNTVTTSNPLSGVSTGTGGNTAGLTLSAVQLDTFNPTTTLDLLGDGTGAIGQDCLPVQGGATGATTCTCAYTYIQPDGTQIGPVQVDTTYSENDMLRCPYTVVPAGVSFINVYIELTNSDTQSNTVTLNLSGGVAGGIDLSNPLSFTQASRYQCKDIVFVPYMWENDIYDPFLSDNPTYSYPLNFYTANMGLTFSEYTGDTNATGWNCPALPNDTAAGMDLTLYSVAADASGSKSIFPPTGAFDRSTFYLANGSAGVFNIPVNAYVYPGMVSSAPAAAPTGGAAAAPAAPAAPPPLGYAASPIPLSGGGETCPDSSVTIPAGFQWAKLWLFRKQLPQRAYPTSSPLAQFGSQPIACNTVPWTVAPVPAAPQNKYFTDCTTTPNWSSLDPLTHLAARFAEATAACFVIQPGGTTNPTTGTNYNGVPPNSSPIDGGLDLTVYAPGSDIWQPTNQDPSAGCTGTNKNDLSRACQTSTGNVPFDTPFQGSNQTAPGLIDSSTAAPRFDYLFVVSPPSVMRQDMVPTATSSTHAIYTPLRFMSPTDCQSADPDQPLFPGDCSSSRMLVYSITVSEAGSAGQTGTNDPDESGLFPMCVLQPTN